MKKLFCFYISIFISLVFPLSVNARCSIEALKNVCNICAERAESKLTTDSTCPVCPEINCPSPSLACIKLDSFQPFLKSSYTITSNDQNLNFLFKLNIVKNDNNKNLFLYDVRYRNFRTITQNNFGYLLYDIVNFNLPIEYDDYLYSYNCTGAIDNTSVIKGTCSTIANDNAETGIQTYSWQFTAIPSDTPLQ
ncbi:MAG: hypothetical protein A3B68_07135 [Candidatus Melainabacteria bacterium RIFCSPHIGHO2_02_FULL_34_12]|nr:MAG: hypothetical protein A3B68_07135 [Candidatus Melainabacteria bacterium RIFCSPHIGHO2_02_FULL_34_12]